MESGSLSLGLEAPHFELPEPLTGRKVSLDDSKGAKAILVCFICNHCPFVIHLERAIVEMVEHFKTQGLATFAISANSMITHPQDGPEKMAEKAESLGYPFPYLYDESQEMAKAYGAVCTPEFYVFDANRSLAYHGRFDESTPRNGKPITGDDLRDALEDILAGRPVQRPMRNSIGCGIKWHPETRFKRNHSEEQSWCRW
ncbi:hypothetical protein WJX81_008581 [Elliptochloris bilobata]|uniref:Thioredoxin domain-containing protein n=1 Tax=Elliptochloris bilobata TaxID=381761 RepID=A0AAW1SEG9_9CHLO